MTRQDLIDNKSRILIKIRYQNVPQNGIKLVMSYMIKFLPIDEKPLMKNIDELISVCIKKYFQENFKPVCNSLTSEKMYEEINRRSLPSSMR